MAADPYRYFRIEAHELVDGLGKGLLDLEKQADPEIVGKLLRFAHTLKGAARIVKHRELADLAHALEDVLAPLRSVTVPQRNDAALALVDRMVALVAAIPAADAAAPIAPAKSLEHVAPTPIAPRVESEAVDDALAGLVEIHAMLARLREDPSTGLDHVEREVRSVRHEVERMRLAPAATMHTALERTARDIALATGKRVQFGFLGAGVRVETQLLAKLHGALVQLVRNAVAHGIEPVERRLAQGKPPEGRLELELQMHGNRLVITCRDDGRGIDLDAVRRRAAQPGLDAEATLRLLLRGGISTSAQVDEHAGRGIGLDVVREAAAQLGGEVTATTTAGRGTSITLAVPASLAAMSSLAVAAGDRVVAFPLEAIRRMRHLAGTDITRTPAGATVAFDDLAIPFASLAALLGARHDEPRTMVVVDGGDGRFAALGIDRTLGVDDIVVRTLAETVPLDPIVWGFALDGAGHPRPVLEPRAVVAAVGRGRVAAEPTVRGPLTVLVVDDSLTTRMLEQSILESAGYAVETASSAEEALERVQQRTYQLMLVDVEMPGMDGFAFIAEIRKRRDLAATPAILVTSRNAPEDRRRGLEVGAQGYVVKSEFDQVALLALIRNLVRA